MGTYNAEAECVAPGIPWHSIGSDARPINSLDLEENTVCIDPAQLGQSCYGNDWIYVDSPLVM